MRGGSRRGWAGLSGAPLLSGRQNCPLPPWPRGFFPRDAPSTHPEKSRPGGQRDPRSPRRGEGKRGWPARASSSLKTGESKAVPAGFAPAPGRSPLPPPEPASSSCAEMLATLRKVMAGSERAQRCLPGLWRPLSLPRRARGQSGARPSLPPAAAAAAAGASRGRARGEGGGLRRAARTEPEEEESDRHPPPGLRWSRLEGAREPSPRYAACTGRAPPRAERWPGSPG